ncbi:MAG: Ig-like domain-containing protein [Sedimentisphaerales bacterium]|nr:Ig-like domain-containing protein [Sedimentisphaerales bacterium]
MLRKPLQLVPITALAAIVLLFAMSVQAAYRIEYEYDSLDRLIKVIHPNGEMVIYSYDEVGNRLQKAIILDAPPKVTSWIIESGQTQRSTIKTISAEFNEDVTITSDALSIIGQTHGSIDLTSTVFDYNSVTFTATWSLPQSLPDDEYTATLDASKIADLGGKNLDGNGDGLEGDNATFEFHCLFGDATGNATVDFTDFSFFASRWLDTPADTGLDTDDNNLINFPDFAAFAHNWLAELP